MTEQWADWNLRRFFLLCSSPLVWALTNPSKHEAHELHIAVWWTAHSLGSPLHGMHFGVCVWINVFVYVHTGCLREHNRGANNAILYYHDVFFIGESNTKAQFSFLLEFWCLLCSWKLSFLGLFLIIGLHWAEVIVISSSQFVCLDICLQHMISCLLICKTRWLKYPSSVLCVRNHWQKDKSDWRR